jgi:hypothetical protein
MDAVRIARWLFGSNAAINLLVSSRGLLDPVGYARSFGVEAGAMAWLVRLWMALVLMFGWFFLQVARDPVRRVEVARLNWLEKSVTASAVTVGYLAHQVPASLMLLVVATNWIWIPVLLWNDLALVRLVRRGSPVSSVR